MIINEFKGYLRIGKTRLGKIQEIVISRSMPRSFSAFNGTINIVNRSPQIYEGIIIIPKMSKKKRRRIEFLEFAKAPLNIIMYSKNQSQMMEATNLQLISLEQKSETEYKFELRKRE